MPKVLIHAGAGKTGTSFLQVLFARHHEEMKLRGIIYPEDSSMSEARSGAVTSGNGVRMANYLRPNLPHNIADKDAFPADLKQHLEAANGQDVLYSSEFIVFPDNARSEVVRNTIIKAGYTPEIVFFVRDLAAAAYSVYSQQVKRGGETRSFGEFLQDWDPHYKAHIAGFEQVFGRASMRIFNYDLQKKDLAGLFFRDVLGLDFGPPSDLRVNRSLTLKEIELMRLINQQIPEQRRAMVSTFVSNALIKTPKAEVEPVLSQAEYQLLERTTGQTIDYINSFIEGDGIKISRLPPADRSTAEVSDFETAVTTILAQLINKAI